MVTFLGEYQATITKAELKSFNAGSRNIVKCIGRGAKGRTGPGVEKDKAIKSYSFLSKKGPTTLFIRL